MDSRKNTIDNKVIILFAVAAVAIGAVYHWVSQSLAIGINFLVLVVFIWQLLEKIQRNLERHQDNIFRQHESLKQLEQYISPLQPLSHTRGFRGSPDFLLEVYLSIQKHKPNCIVEASSGLSTIISAYGLQKVGKNGKVISLEHEQQYATISSEQISHHKLDDFARVVHAPLKEHLIKEQTWTWYDFESADLPDEIDMIIVDGPPRTTQVNARYPALPLLFKRLRPGGILLLDDAARPAEISTVDLWKNEFPDCKVTHLPMEKGMVVLVK